DGSRYKGGWIGKGRTFEIVLRKFHYEQCYWYIHKGGVPHPDAIKTYPDLKRYNDIISDIKQKIKVRTEEAGQIRYITASTPQVNNEPILLHGYQYIKIEPYQQRGYFTHADYSQYGYSADTLNIPKAPKESTMSFVFDLRELLLIAYLRKF